MQAARTRLNNALEVRQQIDLRRQLAGVDTGVAGTYIGWTERDPAGWPEKLLRSLGRLFLSQITSRDALSRQLVLFRRCPIQARQDPSGNVRQKPQKDIDKAVMFEIFS